MGVRLRSFAAALVCLAVAVFTLTYGGALFFAYRVKREVRNTPQIWLIPKAIDLNTPVLAKTPKLSYAGFQFDSPTASVKEERLFKKGAVLSFSDCAGMALFVSESEDGFAKISQGMSRPAQMNLKKMFGPDVLDSDYAFRSKVLNVTPASLRFFSPRYKLAGNSALLMIKNVDAQFFKNGLYSFQTPWTRGFQEGDITHDGSVQIEAYDARDRKAKLIVGNKPGKSCFTQVQLNQIISTLKPASE